MSTAWPPGSSSGAAGGAPAALTTLALRNVFCVHRSAHGDAAALQGASLTVSAGELLCVLGPSGAGKSTLLRVIAGLQTPSAGDVVVLGRDIGRLPSRARSRLRHECFGFLSQRAEESLSPELRAADVVAIPLALRGVPRSERLARVAELLERTGLERHARAWPEELSGGERQRLALCAAIAHRPRLLLADEPTGELDADSARSVRELICAVTREAGATTVLVSHDPASAAVADRTLVIRDGRVAEQAQDGRPALVVAPDGWVRLPPELLARASIGSRAEVDVHRDGLLVRRSVPAGRPQADPAPGHIPGVFAPAQAGGTTWMPMQVRWRELCRARGHGAARREVLAGISHQITPGRLTAVTGRSGAGKTTLLRMLAGIDRADAGELLLDDFDLAGLGGEERARLRRERIGYLPQDPAPVPFLSAEENVVLTLRLRGWPERDARARAAVALFGVGLAERSRQRVARLSAGEVQRVALARALAGARGLLLVDEPTSRLDRSGAEAVGELLGAAAGRERQTVICATHDEALIGRADEVLELH